MIDMNKLRELTAELGFNRATTEEADIDRHRQLNRTTGWPVVIDSLTCARNMSFGDSVRIQQQTECFASRVGADTVDVRLAKRIELPSA
jgi:hypothetical protein